MFLQVKYYKGIPDEFVDLIIPNCEQNCTLDKFKTILKDVIPTDEDKKCDKRSLRNALEKNQIQVSERVRKLILDPIYQEELMKNLTKSESSNLTNYLYKAYIFLFLLLSSRYPFL